MTSLVAIRTHSWGSDAARLCAQLLPALGDRLVVVFHNHHKFKGPPVPIPVIELPDGWPEQHGLQEVADWGWRCGDYFYYALRKARPGFDHYWLIEPDVHFSSDPSPFFAAFDAATEDLLGSRIEPFKEQSRFARALQGMEWIRATFALTRMSGRLIDRLFLARQELAKQGMMPRFYPNDERFCFSMTKALTGYSLAGLESHAPGWFEDTYIAPGPDRLLDEVMANVPPGRVLHPVRDRESLIRAMVGRIVEATAFLARSRGALMHLTDEELDQITSETARQLRRNLDLYRLRPIDRQRMLKQEERKK